MEMTLEQLETENLNVAGNPSAPVIVVCDTPSKTVFEAGAVMSNPALRLFLTEAKACGLNASDFFFVTCSPPIPEEHSVTEGKINKFVDGFRGELLEVLSKVPSAKILMYLGKTAARVTEGKPVQITKIRGRFKEVAGLDIPAMPMLSPTNVLRRPEVADTFSSDFRQVGVTKRNEWDHTMVGAHEDHIRFEWVTDLQGLIDNPPKVLFADTETTDAEKDPMPLLATLCWEDDHAVAVPLSRDYWPELSEAEMARLHEQMRMVLGNPKTKVIGHNFKYDVQVLKKIGVEVANWWADSMQLAFAADENMINKSQADCVRRWVPSMAGYSDAFDKEIDKSHMELVPREQMLPYSCGDALSGYLLAKVLVPLVREDRRQWDCFRHIQMPALRMFVDVEMAGIEIDQEELATLEHTLEIREREMYRSLIAQVPAAVKRRYDPKDMQFSRPEFTADVLFSRDGFNLTPVVFTDGTKKLAASERIPSVSIKQHLPYFTQECPFVHDLIAYQKLTKMRSTYVGKASVPEVGMVMSLKNGKLPAKILSDIAQAGIQLTEGGVTLNGVRCRPRTRALNFGTRQVDYQHRLPLEDGRWLVVSKTGQLYTQTISQPSGFWQYIKADGAVHPKFFLHRVVTGRSCSDGPNFQNIPKRGALAKEFRKIFVPREGFVFLEADESQAELRVAAWMANEITMLRIYREGGDIHAATAAALLGITLEQFDQMRTSKSEVPHNLRRGGFDGTTFEEYYAFKRYQAKAVNFGFLYGMGWRKFKDYAKTDYGLDLTDEDAIKMREVFFALYPRLKVWHGTMRDFVQENGYVRALHGALRRLPSAFSDDEKIRQDCERQAINSPVQRFASDLGLLGMIGFVQGCPLDEIRPVAFIHDSTILEVRRERVAEAAAGIKWFMQNPPLQELFGITCPIPLVADVSISEESLSKSVPMEIEAAIPSWS